MTNPSLQFFFFRTFMRKVLLMSKQSTASKGVEGDTGVVNSQASTNKVHFGSVALSMLMKKKIPLHVLGGLWCSWRSLRVTHACELRSSCSLAKLKALAQQMHFDFGLCVWCDGLRVACFGPDDLRNCSSQGRLWLLQEETTRGKHVPFASSPGPLALGMDRARTSRCHVLQKDSVNRDASTRPPCRFL